MTCRESTSWRGGTAAVVLLFLAVGVAKAEPSSLPQASASSQACRQLPLAALESTLIPPASAQQKGYNTTCTILRSGVVVGVEVTATSKQDMATTQAVKGLVQKARSRM